MECFSLQPSAAAFSAAAPPTSVFVDATSSIPICEFGFGVLRSADGFAAFVPEQRRGHPIKSARRSHVRSATSYLLVVCGDAAVQVLLLRETLATASNSLIFEASHELRLLRNKRHAILGAEWSPFTEDSEFFVVSTDSIDFYSMSRSKKVFMLRRSIPISVTWFQYSQKHSVIAIYSSNAPHCVSILYIGGRRGAVIELAPVNLVSPAPDFGKNGLISGIGSSLSRILLGGDNGNIPATNPFEISRNEVFILQVYDKLYCAYIHSILSPSSANPSYSPPQTSHVLHLHRIAKQAISQNFEFELNLQEPGSSAISLIDNLILVHNPTAKRLLVFDLGAIDKSSGSKVVEPLWIVSDGDIIDLYRYPTTTFAFPHYITPPQSSIAHLTAFGGVFNISLCTQGCLAHLRKTHPPAVSIKFLARRRIGDICGAVLGVLREGIERVGTDASIEDVKECFELVLGGKFWKGQSIPIVESDEVTTNTLSSNTGEGGSGMGFFGATEFYERLFEPLSQTNGCDYTRLATCIEIYLSVYLSSQQKQPQNHVKPRSSVANYTPNKQISPVVLNALSVQPSDSPSSSPSSPTSKQPDMINLQITNLLALLYMKSEIIHPLLYTHLASKTIPPTSFIAHQLLNRPDSDNCAFQTAVQIFESLSLYTDVVSALLSRPTHQNIMRAVDYARRNGILRSFRASRFLEPCLKGGGRAGKTLFLNVYAVLEESGIVGGGGSGGHQDEEYFGVDEEDDLGFSKERYWSVWREVWGETLDMEGI